MRSIFMFVLTVFIAALLWATFGSHTDTHAIDGPTGSWKGESILYDGHQYFTAGDVKAGDSIGLPQGTHYYVYTPDNSGNPPKTEDAFVIYFAPGTDPPTEKTATYASYTYTLATKDYSSPTNKRTFDITPKGQEVSTQSCTIQGIGWIICPITTFLADGMDNIFNIVKGFLVVQPVNTTNNNNDLYIAWNIMRSVANVAFIIVFLIIIYSQLTNQGISNYGLKKLLPRLIIAAVLVNMSYLICAIALDISNILGYSFQSIFIQIRQNTFNISNDTWTNSSGMGWSAITAFVLSGGAATIGIIAATGGTIGGAVYLLIPLLIGLLLTILFVLLILAARQAIIIILIVIAPLAFVAYLLPNTEQWFKKWRELFMTMLVFFPAFSLVFGGAQLAGGLIIQNATSIIGVIFGMAVQVAPLVITPLLLKLSGGLLGRIAGIINDPKKGLLDRTKAWSGSRAEMHKQRGIGGDLKRRNVFRRAARSMALDNNRVERNTNRYKAGFEEYATRQAVSTKKGQAIETASALSKLQTEDLNNNFGQAMQELRAGDSSGLRRLRAEEGVRTAGEEFRMSRIGGALTGGRLSNDEVTANRERKIDANKSFAKHALKLTNAAVELDENSRIIASATAAAQSIQLQNFAAKLKASEALQIRAGGIDIEDERGAKRALAAALSAQSKAHGEAIANATSILTHYNYSDDLVTNIALNKGTIPAGIRVTSDIQEAAIAKIAGGANAGEILRLFENIEINESPENQGIRQTFVETLLSNSNKPKFASSRLLGDAKQGKIVAAGPGRMDSFIINAIDGNKFGSAELLVTQDPDYLGAVLKTMRDPAARAAMNPKAKETILKSLKLVNTDPQYEGRIGERRETLEAMERVLKRG